MSKSDAEKLKALLGEYLNDVPSIAELERLPSELSKSLLEILTTQKSFDAAD